MNNNFTETYEFLVSVIGNSPYGIIAIDLEGVITMCNKLALKQLGIGKKTKSVLETELLDHIKNIPKLHKKLTKCLDSGRKAFNIENLSLEDKILNVKGRRILNGMIITTNDITTAKNIERNMLNAMLEGQEHERKRLAKEIHDGIGPLMSTIKLNIESVKKEIDHSDEKTLKKIDNMEELVQNVATDIRGISHALMPSALRDFGLISALENLVLKINGSESIAVQLYNSGIQNRLNHNIELGLYRITQELINNALKYAKAKNITIQIIKHPEQVTLTVEDDGVGFQKEKIQELVNTGIGLRNINTRTKAMNGFLAIDTSIGNGVTTTVEVPISNA